MLVSVPCPQCQSVLELEGATPGYSLPCPSCETQVTVPQDMLGPGTEIGGFRIEDALESGGMGQVFLARQISMDRLVALKILPPQFCVDPTNLTRFLNEVRTAAQLQHPNIVTAYEAGEDAGIYFLAMEYIEGETLDSRISTSGALGEVDALHILRPIAAALAYAWEHHEILHRDVKPDNILLDEDDEPRLADMGLSKNPAGRSDVTAVGTVMGTPNYMSPEQMEDLSAVDFRSDMYSLGATLYHALTGLVPFKDKTVIKTLQHMASDPLPDPRVDQPNISKSCVDLLRVMMARDPTMRHASWHDLIEDIDLVLAGDPIVAVPPGPRQSVVGMTGGGGDKKSHRPGGTGQPDTYLGHGVYKLPTTAKTSRSQPRHEDDANKDVRDVSATTSSAGTGSAARAGKVRRPTRRGSDSAGKPANGAVAGKTGKRTRRPTSTARRGPHTTHSQHVPAGGRSPIHPALGPLAVFVLVAGGIGIWAVLSQRAEKERHRAQIRAQSRAAAEREQKLEEQLQERLATALEESRRQATEYETTIARLQALVEDAQGTPVGVQASREIERLKSVRERERREAWQELQARAETLFSSGKTHEAMQILLTYDGPHATDLAAERREYVTALEALDAQRVAQAQQQEREHLRTAKADLSALVNAIADDLMDGKTDSARRALDQANDADWPEAMSKEWNTVRTHAMAALSVHQDVLNSFLKDIGRTITVELSSGESPLTITGVKEEIIQVERREGTATSGQDLRVSMLSARERLRRLGTETTDERKIQRALVAIEAHALKAAEKFLASANSPLADALLVRTRNLVVQMQASKADRAKMKREQMAKRDYAVLMEAVGFKPTRRGPTADAAELHALDISEVALRHLQRRAREYRQKHDGTDFVRQYGAVLRSIERAAPGQASVGSDAGLLQSAVARLQQDNPKMIVEPSLRVAGGEIQLTAVDDVGLTDLSALAGLGLTALTISRTGVKDLKPLTGMPLKVLIMKGCKDISDIKPLAGMPLRYLELYCPVVTDVKPLAGMPLRHLELFCPAVADLKPLKGMPLTELKIGCALVQDFDSLKGMKLTYLSAANCQVKNIEVLKGMPLTYLDISSSRVRDLAPLKGMPLKELYVDHTDVRDLTALKDLPLATVSISGLDIKDASPISHVAQIIRRGP